MRRLTLTTIGTLGDLHPFIAIGLALKERGFSPLLAVAEDQEAKARAAGLDTVAILPSFESIRREMGISKEDAVRLLMSSQREFLERILLPSLASCTRALDEVSADAEAIIATPFVFAAPIIAEKRAIPLIIAVLQPMAMLSSYDPPSTPDFWMAKQAPVGRAGALWNGAVYATMRQFLKRFYSQQLDAVRIEHGLDAEGAADMLEPQRKAALVLGCYSKIFGPLPADAPGNTKIVGFPFFDRRVGGKEVLVPVMSDFLRDGPAPVVFTLGTFAVDGAGRFYEQATATARSLGVRAVMLMGEKSDASVDGTIIRCGYVPHSLLFPHAAVIVHHGGVGTTGQALRAGKPQLIVPHMGDQSDHARRIERMGLGLSLKANRFTAARAVPILRKLLRTPSFQEEADAARAIVCREHGSEEAVTSIVGMLRGRLLLQREDEQSTRAGVETPSEDIDR
ncbi:MAG: glycosyltransferase family 1 protein [Sphingomonas sp.]|nr:glycosyltransferase family 1 protein [Sphingomonas sp.]